MPDPRGTRRDGELAALVEYDGTGFRGFQRLKGHRSVQQTLEEALSRLAGQPVRVRAAGRTDAGVHAVGQVVSFPSFWTRGLEELARAVNALLPPPVAVRGIAGVPPGFDPRRSARSREYLYRIWNEPLPRPLLAGRAWQVVRTLDEAAMGQAAAILVGRRDFASLGNPPREQGSTVRQVLSCRVWREGRQLFISMAADAFLRGMVRRAVEALVRIGRSEWPPARLGEILAARDLSRIQGLAPPQGLYLWRVTYGQDYFEGEQGMELFHEPNL